MKEDYLWDKTGSDAEIERLEKMLGAFRYRETDLPFAPPAALPALKQNFRRRKLFRITLSAAACLALLVVFLGTRLQTSENKREIAENPVAANASISPENTAPADDVFLPNKLNALKTIDATIKKASYEQTKKIEISKRFTKQKSARKNPGDNFHPPANSLNYEKSLRQKPESQTAALTKEEKFAYEQLMLALSVTNSQLRIVRDKIEGVEKQANDREMQR